MTLPSDGSSIVPQAPSTSSNVAVWLLLTGLSLVAVVGIVSLRTTKAPLPLPPRVAPPSSNAASTGEPILPIPSGGKFDPCVVALGRRLFHEERLSADGTISCASCHDLEMGGADGRETSTGIGGARGERNAPTVLNSSLHFRQFWDGRAATLEEQVGAPLTHPKEMGSTWPSILAFLQCEQGYAQAFQDCYPDGVTEANVRSAFATFERTLLTPGSRFDRFLMGEKDVITAEEQAGWDLFREIGCITCHQGVGVGGNLFQRFGIASNFFEDRGDVTASDLGRFSQTQRDSDAFKFKVPSLRNVAKTAPYFHDGSVATLEQAIRIMAKYQLGEHISDEEVSRIAAFLHTLSADLVPASDG